MKYGKEFKCLNTKGNYGKVTDTEIKWLIFSKFVMIIFFFVEFINQLMDYLINCASLIIYDCTCRYSTVFNDSIHVHVSWK